MSLMNTQCQNCNEPLTVDFDNDKVVSHISFQRTNCSEAHVKDNCVGRVFLVIAHLVMR